jgi:hypothetical protein
LKSISALRAEGKKVLVGADVPWVARLHHSGLSLGIFSYLIHDCVEIYIDDFISYGQTFEEALDYLEKVPKRCKTNNLSLSDEKCHMFLSEGIILGHHISLACIRVDPTKKEVTKNIPSPKS